jgi:hypothetical protein
MTNNTVTTPYGVVDQTALSELQAGYDTNGILRIVDTIDACRVRLCDPEGIRDDLLRLHSMAHSIVNGARLSAVPDETGIWEMADELRSEFSDLIKLLQASIQQLEPLANLAPLE